jgi:group I intron endonuclease
MIGIYKITSPSGKIYIGQSVNIEKRIRDYRTGLAVRQPKLNRSFLKYGFENHNIETVCECSLDELNDKERFYQDLYNCIGKYGLNCVLTKTNDRSGFVSEETKNKLRGVKRPDHVRLKISESSKGKKVSEETKLRLSEISRNMSVKTRLKKSIAATGKVQSKETRLKISESLKGRNHSDEAKLKISEKHGTKVIDIETGEEFLSVAKAAKHLGCNISNLHQKLKGIRNNNTNLKYA